MELIENLEGGLQIIVAIAQLVLESISIFCVIAGFFKVAQFTLASKIRNRSGHNSVFPFNQVRLRFGSWLALALEFQLGADILATTVTPTLESLGKLALIAVVRTFLNYFLNKELEAEIEREHRNRNQQLELTQKYRET